MKAFKVGNTVVEAEEHFCLVESAIRFDLVDHSFDSGSAIVIFRNFNEPRFMRVDSVERDNCDEEAFVSRRFLGDWVVRGELNTDESSAVMCECPELFPTLHETLYLPEILTMKPGGHP